MSQTLENDRFLRALLRQPVDRTPAWIMRQAGRYLPEYREVRKKAGGFMDLCRSPELATQVTLQPLERFPLDAAILFSDILTVPDAMGLGLYFETGEGPRFERPVLNRDHIKALRVPDIESTLGYVPAAVRSIKSALNGRVPLIGFAGSPWTLATYMVEGGSTRTFTSIKQMLYSDPESLHMLLSVLADSLIDYLNAQIEAGADAIQIFDTWGGVLETSAYQAFSLAYMQRIVEGLKREHDGRKIPVILFTKGGGDWLELMADTGADALGLDWRTSIGDAFDRVGSRVALQGNLDPSILYAPKGVIAQRVKEVLDEVAGRAGHVFNLGHGIHPNVNPEHLGAMLNALHQESASHDRTSR